MKRNYKSNLGRSKIPGHQRKRAFLLFIRLHCDDEKMDDAGNKRGAAGIRIIAAECI